MRLQVFDKFHELADGSELNELIEQGMSAGEGAFWLLHGAQPLLGLFVKGEIACLYSDEKDVWSHNPHYSGKPEDTRDFIMENYESTDMPADSIISAADAVAAFKFFHETSELSTRLKWKT